MDDDSTLVTFAVLEARLHDALARGRTIEAAAIREAIEGYERSLAQRMADDEADRG